MNSKSHPIPFASHSLGGSLDALDAALDASRFRRVVPAVAIARDRAFRVAARAAFDASRRARGHRRARARIVDARATRDARAASIERARERARGRARVRAHVGLACARARVTSIRWRGERANRNEAYGTVSIARARAAIRLITSAAF